MGVIDGIDDCIVDHFSVIKRQNVQQTIGVTSNTAQQVTLQRQIDSEMSSRGSGGQKSQVVSLAHLGQAASIEQVSSIAQHVTSSTSSGEQTSSRLEQSSRSDRGYTTSYAPDFQRSPPLERSVAPPSSTAVAEQTSSRLDHNSRSDRGYITHETLDFQRLPVSERQALPSTAFRDRVSWDERSGAIVGIQELVRSPYLEQVVMSPTYRSHHRTSWIEQANLSSGCVEQKRTFSFEHTTTAPGLRPSTHVSASPEHQRSPESECEPANVPVVPEQRATSQSEFSTENSSIRSERHRVANQSEQAPQSSPFRCECRAPQADQTSLVIVSPEPQKQCVLTPCSQAARGQLVKHNIDVSITTFSKPKLVRLRSEPWAFSTVITDASICGHHPDRPGTRRRRDELKRSLSFEVTSPSYYEALCAGLSAPNQLVIARPQLSRPRLNRKYLSLHLEGVSGDLNLLRSDPPLQFHDSHGDNIELQNNKTKARRHDSFCKGICFSNRPVAINEKVYVKFVETNTSWSGVLRFGFTGVNPATVQGCDLPRYACPDLTNKPGNWAKALGERYTASNILLHFSVNRAGDVIYGVNGEEKGLFFSGVVTSQPLWALLDIYGNTVAVEFSHANAEIEPPANASQFDTSPQTLDSNLLNFSNMSLNGAPSSPSVAVPPPLLRWHADLALTPLMFHTLLGRNVLVDSEGSIATRLKHAYCNAFVFTARPITCGETLVIQVLVIDRSFVGGLGFGLTACDPENVDPSNLPDDSDLLLDRQEYWVVNKNVCRNPEVGDELSFHISEDGEVMYARNNQPPLTLMHVDRTLPLWAFFDVYGNIQKIKLIGSTMTPCQGRLPRSQTTSSYSNISMGDCVPGSGFGATYGMSVLNMDMPYAGDISSRSTATDIVHSSRPTSCLSSPGEYEASITYPATPPATPVSPCSQVPLEEESSDCKVCWERVINCVLYMCGHMCLCFDCAMTIRGEKGLCPICRQVIVDVIKIYKS